MKKTIRRLALVGIAVPAFGILGVGSAEALPPPMPDDPTEPTEPTDPGGGTSTYEATADFNGDGAGDSCVVASADATAACTVKTTTIPGGTSGTGGTNITYKTKVDPGWMAGRAWVDHNGDGKADYCRVVDYTRLACTVSTAPTVPPTTVGYPQPPLGEGFGETYHSQNLDAGWDDTRTWKDANGDGKADYCRITGNFFVGYWTECTLSTGQGFTAGSQRYYF
jgi:hypothetical protein